MDAYEQSQHYVRILIVNHGFPKEFEAGSEIYAYTLAKELSKEHQVAVFCRTSQDNEGIEQTEYDSIPIYRVKEADRYIFDNFGFEPRIDALFRQVLREFKPDVVHIHHLNHLSLGIVDEIVQYGQDIQKKVPIIYTLHDYWLLCHRGQFVFKTSGLMEGKVERCEHASDNECKRCFSTNFRKTSGKLFSDTEVEAQIASRNATIAAIRDTVDLFIAPSRFLKEKFLEYGFPPEKVVYADYGFRTEYFDSYEHRLDSNSKFRFGYIGTAIPAKGIHVLLDAFGRISDPNVELKLYAQPNAYFQDYYDKLMQVADSDPRVTICGAYGNETIGTILSQIDAIVTPSEWLENSPLVMHEAFQANLPVITANVGGMKELVENCKCGLLFEQGNSQDLANKMVLLSRDQDLYHSLQVGAPKVISIQEDAALIFQHCCRLLKKSNKEAVRQAIEEKNPINPGMPVRLTCINSMACNLHCRMCQVHRRPEIARREHAAKNLLPFEQFTRLAAEVFPWLEEFLPTTMGDPMLTPYFDEILPILRKYGVLLNLTTNGTLLSEDRARAMIDILKDVKFSFDGATADTFEKIRRGASFQQVLENINTLIRIRDEFCIEHPDHFRPTVTFQVTLQRDNIEELPDIMHLAESIGVDRVKGYHLYVFEKELVDQSLMYHQQLANEKIREAQRLGHQLEIKTEFPSLFALEGDETVSSTRIICKRLWEEVWIDHNGDVTPCCVPNRPVMGNLYNDSFSAIWNGPEYQRFREGMQGDNQVAFCQNCSLLFEFEPNMPIKYDESVFMCYETSEQDPEAKSQCEGED